MKVREANNLEGADPGFTSKLERERDELFAVASELSAALTKALPHIPGNAVDTRLAMTQPVDQCFINVIAQKALARFSPYIS